MLDCSTIDIFAKLVIRSGPLRILLKKFLRLVDFSRKVGTAPSIRVIQKHKLSVIFAYFLFG